MKHKFIERDQNGKIVNIIEAPASVIGSVEEYYEFVEGGDFYIADMTDRITTVTMEQI